VVIVFAILQRFEVRPDVGDESWDPLALPQIFEDEPVKRGERIFEIAMSVVILVVLAFFSEKVGIVSTPGGEFFANPVITQYIGWISLSLLVSIGLDIYLLWQGRWHTATRVMRIAVNLLSIAILGLLVQGHNAWLAERGGGGFLATLERLPEDIANGSQLIGMHAFRMAFGIALVVTVIDTLVMIFRLVKASMNDKLRLNTLPARKA